MKHLLCYALLSLSFSVSSYTNIMVLGDSLSDAGNYPQSTHLYEKRYDDIAQYAFIPPTNPVSTKNKGELDIADHHFPYPLSKNPSYLLPMTTLDNTKRHYRSLNWTHYLVQSLFNPTHRIIPETMKAYGVNLYGKNISINYAWWAAVTSQGCHDDEYHLKSEHCEFNTILGKSHAKNPEDIIIPSLLSQVDLLKADIKDKKIYTDNNTLYILFGGGNGLYQAQTEWREGGLKHAFKALDLFHGGAANDIITAIDKLTKAPVNGRHFLVVNLHDLSYTPRLIDDTTYKLITHIYTRLFNKRLDNAVANFADKHPDLKIHLFDYNGAFKKWANSDFFSPSLGKQCDENNPTSPYYQTEASKENCMIDKNHGYLYWNNSHPSTLLHAVLADEMKQFLKTHS